MIKKRERVNDEQEVSLKDTYGQFCAQPMPHFTAVKVNVVEWYNMQVTCQTLKAVKVSEVEWYNILVTYHTSGQSKCVVEL